MPRTTVTAGRKTEKRVNGVHMHAIENWQAHQDLKFIAEDKQWTLHKFHEIIRCEKMDGSRTRLRQAIDNAVARRQAGNGKDYEVRETKEITVKDIEEGRVGTQRIIEFIEKSVALGSEESGEFVGESITVAQRTGGGPDTFIRSSYEEEWSGCTLGTKQPTAEEVQDEYDTRGCDSEEGGTGTTTQVPDSQTVGGVRPTTPDRPLIPDVDDSQHEEGYLIDTVNGTAKQARDWEAKMISGRVKRETVEFMGTSMAEALRRWRRETEEGLRMWVEKTAREYWKLREERRETELELSIGARLQILEECLIWKMVNRMAADRKMMLRQDIDMRVSRLPEQEAVTEMVKGLQENEVRDLHTRMSETMMALRRDFSEMQKKLTGMMEMMRDRLPRYPEMDFPEVFEGPGPEIPNGRDEGSESDRWPKKRKKMRKGNAETPVLGGDTRREGQGITPLDASTPLGPTKVINKNKGETGSGAARREKGKEKGKSDIGGGSNKEEARERDDEERDTPMPDALREEGKKRMEAETPQEGRGTQHTPG
ncbi:hypothetical protein BDZ91DRAFT_763479 [Kalaharituber pfeilii]|nr:hypothetical protein BDZ91DRAFT_763479 [Kalaharituber pfeilii]